LGVGTSSPSARIQSNGSGATSSTFSFLARNSSQDVLSIRDDNYIVGGAQSKMILSSSNSSIRMFSNEGNPATLSNLVWYPELTGANAGCAVAAIPKGSGYSSNNKAQFVIHNTDVVANTADGEFMSLRSAGDRFTVACGKFGNGVQRPMLFSSGFTDGTTNANQLWLDIDGDVGINTASSSASARLHVRGTGSVAGSDAFLVQNSTPSTLFDIENNGKITYWATNTAAGTTGVQTINRPSGTINIAAGESSKVVNNSLCTTSSIVLPVMRTNDATALIDSVVPGSGSFTIYLTAAAAAEISVGFFIIN
jgi:hypothetical protein